MSHHTSQGRSVRTFRAHSRRNMAQPHLSAESHALSLHREASLLISYMQVILFCFFWQSPLWISSLSRLRLRVTECPLSLLSSRHRPDAGLQTAACRTTLACRGPDIERTIE
ncbi:hypothetical protein K466DRAFT_11939 [Polyporus arcularius HHB13444]|uniref:Uncharacterized protein n=1 Tax=Polyporus arcularius HHB13444 TaxID=1314778 RepID=A0A5C3NS51_9APHY|nr:hypothetical protein K466DRAFT_11939 [Polyporus arcularius HHB13444]